MSELETTTFDYEALDTEVRIVVRQRTVEIRAIGKRVAQDIFDLGAKFNEVRNLLLHNKSGGFEAWYETEGFKKGFVYNCIHVHESFANLPTVGKLDIPLNALYTLSSPSTPEPARIEALERAKKGERVTVSTARAIVQQHKPAPVTYTKAEDDYQPDVPDQPAGELPVVTPPKGNGSTLPPASAFKTVATVNGHGKAANPDPRQNPNPDAIMAGAYPNGSQGNAPVQPQDYEGPYQMDREASGYFLILDAHRRLVLKVMMSGAAGKTFAEFTLHKLNATTKVEVEETPRLLVNLATDAGIHPADTVTPLKKHGEAALRAVLLLLIALKVKPRDFAALVVALTNVVKEGKQPSGKSANHKTSIPREDMTAMKDAIVAAFGWRKTSVTDGKWGEIQKVAQQLCQVGALPEEMQGVHSYCAGRFENYGPAALAKYYADWQSEAEGKAKTPAVVNPSFKRWIADDDPAYVSPPPEAAEAIRQLTEALDVSGKMA